MTISDDCKWRVVQMVLPDGSPVYSVIPHPRLRKWITFCLAKKDDADVLAVALSRCIWWMFDE